jgi:quercetin dioxygenase-like cupin family protein
VHTETISENHTEEVFDGVHVTPLAVGDRMSVQHVHLEPSARVPEHDHPHEQVGFVYEGTLTLVGADGTEVVATPGESYAVPGDEPHAAVNQGDVALDCLDIFSPPREETPWD